MRDLEINWDTEKSITGVGYASVARDQHGRRLFSLTKNVSEIEKIIAEAIFKEGYLAGIRKEYEQ